MAISFSRVIDASLDELRLVQAALEEFGEAQRWSPALSYQIQLAVEEVGVNIISYGYDDESPHRIEIAVDSDADAVTIEISDDARAFDPLEEAPQPDLESGVADRPVGGLGVYLLRNMMDDMRYQRTAGRNHLTMVKRRDD